MPHQILGNLASWYDHAKDNPKCVYSVNLNDPFFDHRDIHFILDLDAKEIFDDEVNYVTVNVGKKRSRGRDFEDRITIDAKHIQEHGIDAVLTYARGEDRNPELYKYQAQWSLKGGHLYPQNPSWQKGSWEGVTLSPPAASRIIEFEANLDEMKASGITRATVQIRYPKYAQEKEENIHISPARRESLVEKRIFTDPDAKGYAYRVIFNHKKEGKLALPWSAQVGDNYIYAAIPEELFVDEEFTEKLKEAEKEAVRNSAETVLDKFEELF
ncbi:MAG: hypothetical protein GKR87_13125 [Kiritimatiellae bacterium]|nr:hypothetical protein [Kiritimatiellia bacterium]